MKNNENLVYGIRPLIEAIRAGKEIEKILMLQGANGELIQELSTLIKENRILVQYVPLEKLNRLTSGNHQGVAAFISPITYHCLADVIPALFETGENPLILLFDRITDVRNFGAMIRTAECAGAHAVVVPSRNSAQINQDAIKTSAGAILKFPICKEENLKTTIHYLKACGLQILAASEKAKLEYTKMDFTQPTAIIMGSEEDGVSPEYLKLCNAHMSIPILGEIQSLNVSVACGVILYEAVKQRMG